MHIKQILLVALIVSLACGAHSELVWEQTELELHPAVGDDTAVGHFKYQNKGDKPIAIKNVSTSCGCTAASAKNSAEPGEKGEVTATFKIGERTGTQQKMITVTTDDQEHPSTALTLKVVIPQVFELQPTFVYWQAGEAAKPKTIMAKAGKDVSIKNLQVSSSSPDFLTKVEAGSSANEFRINVEPRQTAQPIAARLTIKSDLPDGKSKTLYANASVTRPPSSVTQNVNAAAPGAVNQTGSLPIATANKAKIDACALLTSKEIESVQGEPTKETKPTGKSSSGFSVASCYFNLPTSANSISLTVIQKADGADGRDPKHFWQQMFHRDSDKEKGRETEREKEGEKGAGPEKISGIGDEAFWTGTRVGGDLSVLKGDNYIRISVGGAGDQASKLKKSKELAQIVLKRL